MKKKTCKKMNVKNKYKIYNVKSIIFYMFFFHVKKYNVKMLILIMYNLKHNNFIDTLMIYLIY